VFSSKFAHEIHSSFNNKMAFLTLESINLKITIDANGSEQGQK
jgi:hypothetical protein